MVKKVNFLFRTCLCLLAVAIFSLSVNAKNESFGLNYETSLNTFSKNVTSKLGPSIVMEESILRVDTGNPDEDIQAVLLIKLRGFNVKVLNGCNQPSCQYDLEKFSRGVYKVIVFTSNGNTFKRTIFLK